MVGNKIVLNTMKTLETLKQNLISLSGCTCINVAHVYAEVK